MTMKPDKKTIHLLEPEKIEFAQTDLKLTWVATKTDVMQQATGWDILSLLFIFGKTMMVLAK